VLPIEESHDAVSRFFRAVETRDPARVAACFTADAVFRNMPHEPLVGRAAIEHLFTPILTASERVEWVIHHSFAVGDLVFAERTDRFWIDGIEYHIECNGVFRVDQTQQLIAEVRDYVDLGLWRARLGDVLERKHSPS
jgi:limonene-1,2-epoxide hydrolase